MAGFSAGLFDHIYRNSNTYASPTLVEVDAIDDIESPSERNVISVKLRRYDNELNLLGQLKKSLTFKIATEPADTSWLAIKAAHDNNTPIEMFLFYFYVDNAGQPAATSKALRATFVVSKFGLSQPLEALDVNEVEMMPSANGVGGLGIVEPAFYTVP